MTTKQRTNRRELLLECASKLFLEQGYNATSIRQIADAVGVTEAAIYYHFKDGKRALLQAVVEQNIPTMSKVIDHCRGATSLQDLIMRFGQGMANLKSVSFKQIQWIVTEFRKLDDHEKALIQEKHLAFHTMLASLANDFVDDKQYAEQIAWTLICAGFGYRQLFFNLELQTATNFGPEDLIALLAEAFAEETGMKDKTS